MPNCVCLLCNPLIIEAQLRGQSWDWFGAPRMRISVEVLNLSRSTSIVGAGEDPLRDILAIRASDMQGVRELLCDDPLMVDNTVGRNE
jgi:hypothetical protein